jgi:hypothetical protein
MYSGLLHAHSGLRWLLLVALIFAIYKLVTSRKRGDSFAVTKGSGLFALIMTHLQLVIGVFLYLQSSWFAAFKAIGPSLFKNAVARFYILEHPVMMLLAIVFITIGYSTAKRAKSDAMAYKKRILWYSLGLILIMAAIPWPFRFENAHWF